MTRNLKMKGTLNKQVGGFSFLSPRLGMFLEVTP